MAAYTSGDSDQIAKLACGFRESFLGYAELTTQLKVWADAFPDIVKLVSIGKTLEGRELWLLVLGAEPERVRPAVWVDGNMHASELCGSSAALAIAEDVIRLHVSNQPNCHDLPGHVADRLRNVLFYILPRMSPDGAEAVLRTGRFVRSVPRDNRLDRRTSYWVAKDVDGDGLALAMRKQDPTGEFVESKEVSGLLVRRQLEDSGPYYKVYPEGIIENFDGKTIPTPSFLSDNPTDLNRNFPWSWMPDYQQEGAGPYPMSEPESRAVVEFTSRTPHLFAWLNLHTFGGVFIRPLGHKPDTEMDPNDLALYRQIAALGERHTGYPTVSGYEEFTYEPEKPLHGDLTDYGYHQRGCIAYVCELWDLFRQVGLGSKKRFFENYTHLSRDDIVKIALWDTKQNKGRLLKPWKRFTHPQLREVEVGGLDPRIGLWNPPLEQIAEICTDQSSMFLRVAAMAPHVVVGGTELRIIGEDLTQVDISVENHGYLPTYILSSAKKLAWNEPLYVEATTAGCMLEDSRQGRREVGHLDGWGRGLFDGTDALYFQRSRGNTGRSALSWVVRGKGVLTLRIGSCRAGWITHCVEIK